MDWIAERGFAELFVLAVGAFLALALIAGLLTAIARGVRAAGGAFKRGWDDAEERGQTGS